MPERVLSISSGEGDLHSLYEAIWEVFESVVRKVCTGAADEVVTADCGFRAIVNTKIAAS